MASTPSQSDPATRTSLEFSLSTGTSRETAMVVAVSPGDEVVQQDSVTSSEAPSQWRRSKRDDRSRSSGRGEHDASGEVPVNVESIVQVEQRVETPTKGRPRSRISSGSSGPNRRVGQKGARSYAGQPDVLLGPPFRTPVAGDPVVRGRWVHEGGERASPPPGRRYGPTRGRSTGLPPQSTETT